MREAAGGALDSGRVVLAIGPMVQNRSLILNTTIYTMFTSLSPSYTRYLTVLPSSGGARFTLELLASIVDRIVEWGVPRSNLDDLAIITFAHPEEFHSYVYTLAHGIHNSPLSN